jgi:hypothetical protein
VPTPSGRQPGRLYRVRQAHGPLGRYAAAEFINLTAASATAPARAILTFYADDYVINENTGERYGFVRDGSGAVVWLRYSGRLYQPGR